MTEAAAIADAIMAQAEPSLSAEDLAGLRRRADEIGEIARRLVRNLTRSPFRSFAGLPEGAILVAEALRPADAALLDPSRLAGVVTEEGGADGHTAVMLRALGRAGGAGRGRPGARHAAGRYRGGGRNRRDGDAEPLGRDDGVGAPGGDGLRAGAAALCPAAAAAGRHADGEPVELQANLELPVELPLIVQSGAVGIGLLRTEFLFMNRETIPDEATQTESYRTIVEAMHGDPVTIRVLDWGGEKEIEALTLAGIVPEIADTNPALGAARDQAVAAAAGTAGDAVRGDPACLDGRDGAGVVADGHHRRRGPGGAGGL